MDRLEAVEIRKSNLESTIRIDAEYYQKSFLNYQNIVYSQKYILLNDVVNFIIGPFGSSFLVDNYSKDTTYRYIRGRDVKPFYLKDDENTYIPKKDYDRLSKYALQNEDLLISVVGTLGNVSIVTNKEIPAIFSCKSTVIRCIRIDPFFLLTYLNTRIIKNLLLRRTRGTVQTGLNLDDLKNIELILFSNKIQSLIKKLYNLSKQYIDNSKSLYSSAEKLLLSHLGLDKYTPNGSGIAIKSLSESFGASGRLDSEYYLPKYEEIEKIFGNLPTGYSILQDHFTKNTDAYYENNDFHNYIEIGDIDISSGTAMYNKIHKDDLPANAKINLHKGDIIYSTVRPYRGAVAICEFDEKVVVSSAFTVLHEKNIFRKEYLFILLKSSIYRDYIMKYNVGSSYPVIKDDDVLNLKIPNIDPNIQSQIADKVQESFALRKKSTELLELAKTAVEIAIEQGEEKAMQMLQNQI